VVSRLVPRNQSGKQSETASQTGSRNQSGKQSGTASQTGSRNQSGKQSGDCFPDRFPRPLLGGSGEAVWERSGSRFPGTCSRPLQDVQTTQFTLFLGIGCFGTSHRPREGLGG
jgi:hypothetical protein